MLSAEGARRREKAQKGDFVVKGGISTPAEKHSKKRGCRSIGTLFHVKHCILHDFHTPHGLSLFVKLPQANPKEGVFKRFRFMLKRQKSISLRDKAVKTQPTPAKDRRQVVPKQGRENG